MNKDREEGEVAFKVLFIFWFCITADIIVLSDSFFAVTVQKVNNFLTKREKRLKVRGK